MKRGRKSPAGSRSGTALVIVLAFVALLAGMVVGYLALSKTDHQLASVASNGSKVDQLAASALDVVVGDLKQEIAAGSTSVAVANQTVYLPLANTNMMPVRSGNPPPVNGADPIPNLVRVSTRAETGSAPLVSSRASALSSTNAPLNGRVVPLNSWNAHYLVPRSSAATNSAAFVPDPVAGFMPPDWVFVTSQGPQVLATPTNSVIGRYAYAVYDEGGLLDLNVAGFPSGTTPAQQGGKGSLAYADLTVLGLSQAQIDDLVGWRNYASAQPSGDFSGSFSFDAAAALRYFAMLTNTPPLTGFLKVAGNSWNGRTDQSFTSRQNLIAYWTSRRLPPDALQYVGTFSRETNAPSWKPYYDAASLGGAAGYAYKSNAEQSPAPTNPDVLNVRFANGGTLTAYALDGTEVTTPVRPGQSLVARRFCLGRLAWLTYNGPSGGIANAAAAIRQHFGLAWGADASGNPCWVYTSPDGPTPATSIKTLAQVAALNPPREPDFFELLQAGMLAGSLARDAGAAANPGAGVVGGPASDTQAWDQTAAYQILQVGANIIDQYDSDSYPTEITANIGPVTPCNVYGIENLPYLDRVFFLGYHQSASPDTIAGAFLPELWNPHQQPAGGLPGPAPTQFRLTATGQAYVQASEIGKTTPSVPTEPNPFLLNSATATWSGAACPTVQFAVNPTEPHILQQAEVSDSSTPKNLIATAAVTHDEYYGNPGVLQYTRTNAGRSLGGLWVGDVATNPADSTHGYYFNEVQIMIPSSVTFYLQYLAPDNTWRVYTQMKAVRGSNAASSVADVMNPYSFDANFFVAKPDPRTDRFGVSGSAQALSTWMGAPNVTLWAGWAPHPAEQVDRFTPLATAGFTTGGVSTAQANTGHVPGMLVQNRATAQIPSGGANLYYKDPDGVVRRADGAYAVRNVNDGLPIFTGNSASRPVILNRPFRGVADLGYAFRDEPWKHIDFFTPESGDAALLDLFTMSDVDVAAGQVSLNTRQPRVLQALLSGANKVESTPSLIAASDAATIASAIAGSTASSPTLNRAELVSRFKSSQETDARFTGYPAVSLASASDNRIKAQRESLVRALADTTTTRTWNLMIDVIAQSGHYPSSATTLDQFVVDGQCRYWLHIAIDRYTGQVVDRFLEPVYE